MFVKTNFAIKLFSYRVSESQTKRDNYTQVPKPSIFLHGLRGGLSVAKAKGADEATEGSPYSNWCKISRLVDYTKVNLTLPVEDHFCGSNDRTEIPMK